MTSLSLEERARLHAALAEPARLAIVDELALSDRSPTELGRQFGLRSNLLAHHLDTLEEAGLVERVTSAGDKRRRYVRLLAAPLGQLLASMVVRVPGVTFVCTANSARSQLAAAMWNQVSAVPASSAGTRPADRVHPGAVAAADRLGLDLAGARPADFDPAAVHGNLLVTVCDMAHEELVALGAATDEPVLHWSIPDPAAHGSADDFDAAANAIGERIRRLAGVVTLDTTQPPERESPPHV